MSKSKTGNRQVLSRRDALKLSAGAGVAAAITSAAHASDSIKTGVHQQQPPFCSTPHSAVANTKYGEEKGKALADGMRKAYPQKSVRTLSYMCGGGGFLNGLSMRNGVVRMAKLKHDLHAAPVYTYYFTWQTKMLDGVPGAWHTSDLQFCFDNTLRCEQGTGNTPEAQALAKMMATA